MVVEWCEQFARAPTTIAAMMWRQQVLKCDQALSAAGFITRPWYRVMLVAVLLRGLQILPTDLQDCDGAVDKGYG